MTTQDALLAAILANPADDLPRLVFADWMEENGQPERAEFIRIKSPKIATRYFSTKYGRFMLGEAKSQLAGAIPKSWSLWLNRDPEVYPIVSNRQVPESWWASCGDCHFTASSTPFLVAFRHGFIDAVAAGLLHLKKVLPDVVRVAPVTRVCVINHFFGDRYDTGDESAWDEPGQPRVIRQWVDLLPEGVWSRLTPEPRSNGRRMYRLYPDSESLHKDLGSAMLAWAKAQPIPART